MSIIAAYEPYSATLIEKGEFLPPTGPNQNADSYQAMQYGWYVGFNVGVDFGDYDKFHNGGNDYANRQPPRPDLFDLARLNVDALLDAAVNSQVDYLIFCARTEWCYDLTRTNVKINLTPRQIPTRPNGRTFLTPAYPDGYGVQQSPKADQYMLDRLSAGCKQRGIRLGLYYNTVNDLVNCDGYTFLTNSVTGFTNGVVGVPLDVQEASVDFWARKMQEDMYRYGIDILWLDYGGPLPENMIPEWARQKYFNAIMSVNEKATVVINCMGRPDELGPGHVVSMEEYFYKYGNKRFPDTPYYTYRGQQYYLAKELCDAPYDRFYLFPGASLDQHPRAQVQAVIDYCHQQQCPYLPTILINADGELFQQDIDYLNTFQIRRTPRS